MSEPTATSVYTYFDDNEVLIYVGITSRGMQRQREHNNDKAWWPFVARQSVEHFPSSPAAHLREIELIQKNQPPFNSQHNPHHIAMERLYRHTRDVPQTLSFFKIMSTGTPRLRVQGSLSTCGLTIFSTQIQDCSVIRYIRIDIPGSIRVLLGSTTVGRVASENHRGVMFSMSGEVRRNLTGLNGTLDFRPDMKTATLAPRRICLDALDV